MFGSAIFSCFSEQVEAVEILWKLVSILDRWHPQNFYFRHPIPLLQ